MRWTPYYNLVARVLVKDCLPTNNEHALPFDHQLDDLLVQVPRVGVEQAGLGRDGFHDARVTVPHRGDIVVAIEVALAPVVEEPDAFTPHQVDGVLVEEPVGGTHGPLAA